MKKNLILVVLAIVGFSFVEGCAVYRNPRDGGRTHIDTRVTLPPTIHFSFFHPGESILNPSSGYEILYLEDGLVAAGPKTINRKTSEILINNPLDESVLVTVTGGYQWIVEPQSVKSLRFRGVNEKDFNLIIIFPNDPARYVERKFHLYPGRDEVVTVLSRSQVAFGYAKDKYQRFKIKTRDIYERTKNTIHSGYDRVIENYRKKRQERGW